MEETTFTLLETFQYPAEASIYKGRLECEGIDVFMRDDATINANPLYSNAIGGVKLYVKNEDSEKAQIILSEISKYSLDDNNKLIICPNCGAQQIEMVTSIRDWKSLFSFIISSIVVLIPFYANHKYKCSNCKFEFKK